MLSDDSLITGDLNEPNRVNQIMMVMVNAKEIVDIIMKGGVQVCAPS